MLLKEKLPVIILWNAKWMSDMIFGENAFNKILFKKKMSFSVYV